MLLQTMQPSRPRPLSPRIVSSVLALILTLSVTGLIASPAHAAPIHGAPTAGDPLFPHVGNGDYDAIDYDIRLAWTPADPLANSTIEAATTMLARAAKPLRSFTMDFKGLNVDSVTVNGVAATFARDIDPTVTKYKLVITPAKPVQGVFTTKIRYSGVPSRHIDADGAQEGWSVTSDGAISLGQPVGSMATFPHNNTSTDKATYTVGIEIPNTITNAAGTGSAAAVSNGELVSRTPNSDDTRTTWTWRQDKPMASELAVFGIGKYDFLESSVVLSDGRRIPEYSFVDSALSGSDKDTVNRRRAQLSTIISNLEGVYGPYPGNSTGVIVDSVPSAVNYALETQDRSFFPSAGSVAGNTLVHELIHQWYGASVSRKQGNDLWLNEGMATWGTTHYNNAVVGTSNTTTGTYFSLWNNTAASSTNWRIAPSGMTDSATLFDWHSYNRGAMIWEALRTAIGEDVFFTLMKRWHSQYAGTSRGVADLQSMAEHLSGKELSDFFDQWAYTAGKPSWPDQATVALSSSADGQAVAPGDQVGYMLTATNTGKVPLAATQAVVDVTKVLARATIDAGNLPAGVALHGNTLTWTVPSTPVGGTSSTTVSAIVAADASSTTLSAQLDVPSPGGRCIDCRVESSVGAQPITPAGAPLLAADPTVGVPVAVEPGDWAGGTTFTQQWLRDGQPIRGATRHYYTPTTADLGHDLSVTVTGHKSGHTDVTRTSPARTVQAAHTGWLPMPRVTGATTFGKVLGVVPGNWENGTTFAYQWLRDGLPIRGATLPTYRLTAADVGSGVAVEVTGTSPGGRPRTQKSAPVGPVSAARLAPGRLLVKGKARPGRTLRVRTEGWSGGTVSYRWTVGGKVVRTTGPKFKVKRTMRNKKIRLKVTVRKPGHVTETRARTFKVRK